MRPRWVLSVAQGVSLTIMTMLVLASRGDATRPDEGCAISKVQSFVTYASSFGQQHTVMAESKEWRIRLAGWQPAAWPPRQFTFQVKNERTGTSRQLTFDAWGSTRALQVNQVDEIHVFGNKFLLLGRAGANSSEVDIMELPSGKILDRFSSFMPAVSPDRRFVAFLKVFPGHPGPVSINAEYLIYSLDTGSDHLRAVYPPGATTAPGGNLVPGLDSPVHWISSERLFWIDASTVVFTDHYPGEDKLVVVKSSGGTRAPVVRTETLPAGELIELERCRTHYSAKDLTSVSLDPSGLIRVKEIAFDAHEPGHVCLRFEPNPCLTRMELAVQVP
jgi:hypothetical protein